MQMNHIRTPADLIAYLELRLTECDEMIANVDTPELKSRLKEYASGLNEARQAASYLTVPKKMHRTLDKITGKTAKSA